MSRCSLQLYVNENFTFSRPSLASSDDFLKNLSINDWKKSSLTASHTDKDVLQKYKLRINKNCLAKRLNGDKNERIHPILTNYLLQHTKSIEAYRRIRNQQEEILNLCRKKLAKKLSASFLSGIRDEDIIRALRIIQDTELEITEPHHSDEIIHSILKGIISNDSKWSSRSEYNGSGGENRVISCASKNISYSNDILSKPRKRYSLVFKKLKALFKKRRSYSDTFSVVNELNNQITNKKSFLCCPENIIGQVGKEFIYPYRIEGLPQNFKIYTAPVYGKLPRHRHTGMGSKSTCACHRNLVKLQNEFVKQQSEIRLINQNLEQCLCILHDIGDKPQVSRSPHYEPNPYKKNIHVYNVSNPQSGPYGDRYQCERTSQKNSFQGQSSPQRQQKGGEKKKGGCGKPKHEIECPEDCSYSKLKVQRGSHLALVARPPPTHSVPPAKQLKPKRRRFCGCCSRKYDTGGTTTPTSSVTSEPRTIKCPYAVQEGTLLPAMKGSRKEDAERKAEAQLKNNCKNKYPQQNRTKTKQPPHVCHQACARWSDLSLTAKQTSISVQTTPTREYPVRRRRLLQRLKSKSDDMSSEQLISTTSPYLDPSKDGSRDTLQLCPEELVPCSKYSCSEKQGKSKKCKCVDCKRAQKSEVCAQPSILSTTTPSPYTSSGSKPSDKSDCNCKSKKGKPDKSKKKKGKKKASKSKNGSNKNIRITDHTTSEQNEFSSLSTVSDTTGKCPKGRGNIAENTVGSTQYTDKNKKKRPCCLVRFCKMYICRG